MTAFMGHYLDKWERYASVRSHPRRTFSAEKNSLSCYFFPPGKQLLCAHSSVLKLGEEAKHFILTQSLYKYSNDIAMIETEVINRSATAIANQRLPVFFPLNARQIALSVLTDEAYHAFVALDCMNQIVELTGITPLLLPSETELSHAIHLTKQSLDSTYHSLFELIAVCIAENTVTKELLSLNDEQETNPIFQHIVKEHLADEARHAGFFQKILAECWVQMDEKSQPAIGGVIPFFLRHYLSNVLQISFDRTLLLALKFNVSQVEKILEDTHGSNPVSKHHPMMKNIINQLDKTGVLENTVVYEGLRAEKFI